MIYTLKRDDIPLLSQWIKKTMENVSFSIVFLVRMTGFEPTRLSTLEPDGNVTSVETPVPVLSLFTYLVYHRNRI